MMPMLAMSRLLAPREAVGQRQRAAAAAGERQHAADRVVVAALRVVVEEKVDRSRRQRRLLRRSHPLKSHPLKSHPPENHRVPSLQRKNPRAVVRAVRKRAQVAARVEDLAEGPAAGRRRRPAEENLQLKAEGNRPEAAAGKEVRLAAEVADERARHADARADRAAADADIRH